MYLFIHVLLYFGMLPETYTARRRMVAVYWRQEQDWIHNSPHPPPPLRPRRGRWRLVLLERYLIVVVPSTVIVVIFFIVIIMIRMSQNINQFYSHLDWKL